LFAGAALWNVASLTKAVSTMIHPLSRSIPKQALIGGLALAIALLATSCSLFGLAASAGLIKLQFGCLVEGEEIDTPTGPVPVEMIAAGDLVIGYDGTPVMVLRVDAYAEDPTRTGHLAVFLSNGGQIHLSPRHRIMGLPAGGIDAGDKLHDQVVTAIRPLGGVSRSYDLLTEDRGYRVHGVPVNSMIREMEAAAAAGARGVKGSGSTLRRTTTT